MGLKKLLEKLQKYLDMGEIEEEAIRCDRIDVLLEKLRKKEKKLKKKLSSEKDNSKLKQLNLELRIVSMERKKGAKRRKELKDRCE